MRGFLRQAKGRDEKPEENVSASVREDMKSFALFEIPVISDECIANNAFSLKLIVSLSSRSPSSTNNSSFPPRKICIALHLFLSFFFPSDCREGLMHKLEITQWYNVQYLVLSIRRALSLED